MNEPSVETSPDALPVVGTNGGSFFAWRDKVAFAVAGMVSFIGYLLTLAPSVTLEDSGEFITATYHLGVPHPPGYPIWTILSWLWQLIIPFGNIAWRVNLMSAFFGAVAVGLCAMLVSKTGHVMALRVGFLRKPGQERMVNWIILASAVTAGLLLAFSPVMWSQSVIAEVYALNAFFLFVVLVLLYRWSFETEKRWRLYLAAFVWGVSLTNHQTLVLLTVAFPAFVWFSDKQLGRDVLVPILSVIVVGVLRMIVMDNSMFHAGSFSAAVVLVVGVGAGVWLYYLFQEGGGLFRMWKQMLTLYVAVALGLALYGYSPLSSATNPPMNWGYTRTPQGFLHHFTRGQYEKVKTERTILQFWGQLNMFFDDLQEQFHVVFALLALLCLFFYRDMDQSDRNWVKFLLIAFLFLGLGFLFLSNPTFDKQKQFTDRVFFLPGHCLFALWIGYGLILGLGAVLSKSPPGAILPATLTCVVAVLPSISVLRNWGENEQRDHDFGYKFGYLMFKPGGGYPEMDRDAVLFGGTDPGRFVPTYMIFVESQAPSRAKTTMAKYPESGTFDRRDVYIITQNALADSTYMSYIRDHYDYSRPDPNKPETLASRSAWQKALFHFGWKYLKRNEAYPKEPIWIPSDQDTQAAFQQYVAELQSRQRMPGEEVAIEGGRVSVQGVAGVMAINGILTKMIHDKNKDKRSFYVEESYVIPWMYPHMEPYGIILKINKDPIPGPDTDMDRWKAMVERDKAYWDALCEDLVKDPKFNRDDVAQKTFSKLRSAIGGLYAARRLPGAAEYAYRQAIDLCPSSPEANYRLTQLYMDQGKFDEGRAIMEKYQEYDPYNTKIQDAINAIKDIQRQTVETQQLEAMYAQQPANKQVTFQLMAAYARRQKFDAMNALVATFLARTDISPEEIMQIAQLYGQLQQADRVGEVLALYTQRFPNDPRGWFNLAALHAARNNCDASMDALARALALDTPDRQVFNAIRQDARFRLCQGHPRLMQLLGQQPQGANQIGTLPGGISITR
jgi:thioredoxin-like negative regulator of GroEL